MPLAESRMSANAIVLCGRYSDVSAASATTYFAAPEAGYIKEIHIARDGALGTGNNVLTLTTQAGAVGATLTMATAGAAGDTDSLELSKAEANNYVAAGEGFWLVSDGGGVTSGAANVVVVLEAY